MKKKWIGILAAAAFVSVLTVGIGRAHAYFTTYVEAQGTRTVHLGDITTIDEGASGDRKYISIQNDAASPNAVWVRARAIAAGEYADRLLYEGSGWSEGDDGFWYYDTPVEPGAATKVLTATVTLPADAKEGDQFNVVVVYETTIAVVDSSSAGDGSDDSAVTYLEADWNGASAAE